MAAITHFAGVNTARLARATEGHPILVSYADILRRPGVWENEIRPRLERGAYPSVILDSGAFTVISAGISIDVHEYAAFAAAHAHLFDVIVNLDDIAGDVETTAHNQAVLEAAGVRALPVFHQGEDFDVLRGYLATHHYVGVGLARKPGGRLRYSKKQNAAFLTEFFEIVGRRALVHGFGMTCFAQEGFAFDTVDSTTWIAEYCSLRSERRARAGLVKGRVEGWLADFDDDQLLELTLASHRPPAPADLAYQEIHLARVAIEEDARHQARTVLRRYGAARLITQLGLLAQAA